jgi:hypothetical protein
MSYPEVIVKAWSIISNGTFDSIQDGSILGIRTQLNKHGSILGINLPFCKLT